MRSHASKKSKVFALLPIPVTILLLVTVDNSDPDVVPGVRRDLPVGRGATFGLGTYRIDAAQAGRSEAVSD
jgi:hypothetical protein